jgi:probable rRNA maturation factor
VTPSIRFQQLISGFRLNNKRAISAWIQQAIRKEGFSTGEITIVLCSDEYLLEVNRKYLNHNYFTDIITFDYSDNQVVSGDLLISIDRIRENAKSQNVSVVDETHRVIIHGVLHLCGYKDKRPADQKKMRSREDFHLRKKTF